MSKIGIMTWFRYMNYGTVLQASAIYKKIEELGYTPELIDYTPRGAGRTEYKFTASNYFDKTSNKLKNIYLKPYSNTEKTMLFDRYLSDTIHVSEKADTYPELQMLNKQYDAFVCGSDQIWSPLCFDEKYYLSFVENKNKMIAYAPSIGSNGIKNEYFRQKISKLVSRFESLSIRESQGAELIDNLTGKCAKVVLDPTLLLKPSEWAKLINDEKIKKLKDKYILCYFLGDYKKYKKVVDEISKLSGLPIYTIPIYKNQIENLPFEVGPAEFVDLIQNAKYVCTDSFHGVAFSVNYNIPFTVFKRFKTGAFNDQNSRITNILELMKLEERLYDPKKTVINKRLFSCDFSDANVALQSLRKESINYLEKALKKATQKKATQNRNSIGEKYTITDMCCGCGACTAVCKTKAVEIVKNKKGFDHYYINQEKCVKCGMCKRVCPFSDIDANPIKESFALYSFQALNEQVLNKSSSGGFAHILSEKYNRQGFLIAGCEYLKYENRAKHSLVASNSLEQLSKFQGSKYIQSNTSEVFQTITNLGSEDKLLFFGTPCQVAGLDKLLRLKGMRNNAILVDLICHGVPSQLLWDKYISDTTSKYSMNKNPTALFREKNFGWRSRTMKLYDGTKIFEQSEKKDNFYAFFRRGLFYMDTCYECPYREKTSADIRIGDYWGSRFESDNEGVSMIITNTITGRNVISELGSDMVARIQQHDLKEYWEVQYPYNQVKPAFFDEMFKDLSRPDMSISKIRKKYCSVYDISETVSIYKIKVKKLLSKVKK